MFWSSLTLLSAPGCHKHKEDQDEKDTGLPTQVSTEWEGPDLLINLKSWS